MITRERKLIATMLLCAAIHAVAVLAVHPGDVAALPLPAAEWLLGAGLLGLMGVVRRKTA